MTKLKIDIENPFKDNAIDINISNNLKWDMGRGVDR